MRKSTLTLSVICLASMVLAGALARFVHKQQMEIAQTRNLVSTTPLGGFQKFTADIQWMLFIQYGGSNDVDKDSAKEFYERILSIIENDPDFYKAYYTGVLMLGPVAPEYALDIANRGLQNPRVRRHWQLSMLAGQILMNKEKMKYYNNQPMNRSNLERASYYFEVAKDTHGSQGIALRSYVRSLAALKPDNRRLELKEIEAWYDYWRQRRYRVEGGDYTYSQRGDGGYRGRESDVENLLLTQMRVAKRRYPDDPEVDKLVTRIVREAFPNQRLDPVRLEPYDPGDRYSPHSGVKVEVYGVCESCGVVLKGQFCHMCGEDSAAAEEASPPEPRQRPRNRR